MEAVFLRIECCHHIKGGGQPIIQVENKKKNMMKAAPMGDKEVLGVPVCRQRPISVKVSISQAWCKQ